MMSLFPTSTTTIPVARVRPRGASRGVVWAIIRFTTSAALWPARWLLLAGFNWYGFSCVQGLRLHACGVRASEIVQVFAGFEIA